MAVLFSVAMDKLHILMVCPDGTMFRQLKQAGTLALSLNAVGVQVSLLVGGVKTSPLSSLAPDITCHTADPEDYLLAHAWPFPPYLARALKKILSADNTIDIIHVIDCAWPASELARVARKINIPIIGRLQSENDITSKSLPLWLRWQHQKNLRLFRPLVVSSNHLLEVARKNNLDDIIYIPEGVDIDQFKPVLSKRPIRRELGLPEKATLICCMADVCPDNKQLDVLAKCLPLSETLQLLFIGNITDKDYADKIAHAATGAEALSYIHFLDAVDNPEDYLKSTDLFILLGGIEDRHTTILEAQSAGIPVILAPSPSALMLTNGNRCGVVLYPNNPLAQRAFEKLLHDPIYRQGRAVNTRPYVKKEFPFGRMVKAYYKLYQSL